jgi:hypothetical protein
MASPLYGFEILANPLFIGISILGGKRKMAEIDGNQKLDRESVRTGNKQLERFRWKRLGENCPR